VDQPFFQRHLLVTGSVKTNDFINPLLSTSYTSKAVFASLQASLRLKKWPVLVFSYSPSAQLIKLSNDQWQENLFYLMTATASESYKVQHVSLVSMVMYTKFYNRITDTGFVYFNTSNFFMSHTAMIGRLTLQLQGSMASNASYSLYVLDGSADYRLLKWLSVGGGTKYNDQTVYKIRQWGYSTEATMRVPKVGDIRVMWDKGFIPGNNKQLVPNNLGRITYSKIF
jgi:hypothetical protein